MSSMVELCVHMDCEGCEAKIRKALNKLKGVDTVEVDMASQKVTVTGWADQKKVLKAVRKTGRRAVLWPTAAEYNNYSYSSSSYSQQPSFDQSAYPMQGGGGYLPHPAIGPAPSSSYNYYKHGYDNGNGFGPRLLRRGSSLGEKARAYFSDENPNACSIM